MLRRISNPKQNSANTLKAYVSDQGCCGEGEDQCKYVATFADGAVTAVVVKKLDGTNQTITFTSATGAANVKAALLAAIEAADIDGAMYENDMNRYLPGVEVVDNGSTLTVTIIGELPIVSITHAGGSQAATATCTEIGLCTYYIETAGTATDSFDVNNVAVTLDLTFATHTGAQVSSAISGAANFPANSTVSTNKNTTTSKFEITITAPAENTIKMNGTKFTRTNCHQDYV